jgi:hypothetical protein
LQRENLAFITYKESKVAERVAARKQIKYLDYTFQVKLIEQTQHSILADNAIDCVVNKFLIE